MHNIKAVIFGCKSTNLSQEERRFFEQSNPVGFILFARNIDNPQQVKQLVDDLKACVTHDKCLILIDQEGGRVARLKPPYWEDFPPMEVFSDLGQKNIEAAQKATYLNYRLIGAQLQELGINVNCAPVLDIPVAGSDDIIGDRALGIEPNQVTILGRAVCDGLLDAGVLPVIKHIPGHGRAQVDSHLSLPVIDESIEVLEASDFVPFENLADCPIAMTAHIKYSNLDRHNCATMSKAIINIIRQNIGFNGLILSDDLSMKALDGSLSQRAVNAINAGCDIALHCNGEMEEMLEISANIHDLSPPSTTRLNSAYAQVNCAATIISFKEIKSEIAELLAAV